MSHRSVAFLSEEDLQLRDRIEQRMIALEGIAFAGLSTLKGAEDSAPTAYMLTLGTDNLGLGKAQLINVVSILEKEELTNVEVQLVRGVARG
jgi:hypothetical protein